MVATVPSDARLLQQLQPLLNARARGMARRFVGTRGAGKSFLMALLAYVDVSLSVPTVIFDPSGALTNWLLALIEREPDAQKQRLLSRIRYSKIVGEQADGQTYLTPFPLLYRLGNEPLQEIAERPLEVWRQLDPQLTQNPTVGWNKLSEIGSYVGMLLAGMEPMRQLTEATDFLDHPEAWRAEIAAARERYPDELAIPAEYFLTKYPTLKGQDLRFETNALRAKLQLLNLNPRFRAMYGASVPGLNLSQVINERLLVIMDFQQLKGQAKNFAILWLYKYWFDAFTDRGPGKDQLPIACYFDEISYILPRKSDRNNPLSEYFAGFISRDARNNNIWLTVAHQELRQFDDDTNDLLATLGMQVFGTTADLKGAIAMAERFYRYDPYAVKGKRPQFATSRGVSEIIHEEPHYFTYQEQAYHNAQNFMDLETFKFLIGVTEREGQLPTSLTWTSFAAYAADKFPNGELTQPARTALAKRDGQAVAAMSEEIAHRLPGTTDGGRSAPAPPTTSLPPRRRWDTEDD